MLVRRSWICLVAQSVLQQMMGNNGSVLQGNFPSLGQKRNVSLKSFNVFKGLIFLLLDLFIVKVWLVYWNVEGIVNSVSFQD